MILTTPQERAVKLLVRHFGMASGNAAARVLQLTDGEVTAFNAAGQEGQAGELHPTLGELKTAMKEVLSRAYELRNSDEGRSGDALRLELTDRNNAREIIHQQYGLTADHAAEVQGWLDGEQTIVAANLVTRHDCRPLLDELLGAELLEALATLTTSPAE